ncbi:MAG TPA: adenylosuccinate synthase [Candidatus Acidoferrales bacterium]|nr:adenylosuccinate synthase [Candidatus Acidoferrales bacterium]HTX57781.1 adenylosuccinate synthase [Candidatus Acidoferrales bacterium]
MTKADIIVGIQWGDEGKGRVVDLYARDYDVVARFGGGDNAGHQIKVGDVDIALRIVPSGVLNPGVELFVGGGTVINPVGLLDELDRLAKIGVDVSRVKISDRAHMVLPYHAAQDRASERARGASAIGTTGRGIGPAYVDKAARSGITFAEFSRPQSLAEKIRLNLLHRAALLEGENVPGEADIVGATLDAAERLAPHVVDGVAYIHEKFEHDKRVLIEGAQGSLLDVGYGTYPYVTSSHTIAGGACTGLGIGPSAIGRVVGVVKAYCTRVGAGPFPSELLDERGDRLRKAGGEFGTVTGRPRRCGWFDAVAGRYAVKLNGLAALALTKLDVLQGFERIGIVTGYRLRGQPAGFAAAGSPELEVVVEELEGWNEPLGALRSMAALPQAARRYIARIEEELATPVELVSVGRERHELVGL